MAAYAQKRGDKKNFAWKMVDTLIADIAQLTDEAKSSESFQKWLNVQSAFHEYSWYNSALIMIQAAKHGFAPTRVAGGGAWKKVGRTVNRDDFKRKKLWILAPMFRNEDENGTTSRKLIGFRNVYVFDVSQTTGDDLPELEWRQKGDDNGLCEALEAEYERRGIKLEYVDGLGGANGTSSGGHVRILESLTGQERAGTLAHELAHEILHWAPGGGRPTEPGWYENHSRSTKEIEAESTAAVVMGAWGLDYSPSAMYLACWEGDSKKVKESMKSIQKASKDILTHIMK
tara:strand:+ start:203 stop:1063 length:861 start_codon:yes stop_codon:yes gene_type:complete